MHSCVVSNSIICLYQTRIKIHAREIYRQWQLKHYSTLSNESTTLKLNQENLLPVIWRIQAVYISETKFYRNYSTSDSTHTNCISCHICNSNKWQKRITRTELTLRQHGKLQIQRKRIKSIQSYTNLCNIRYFFNSNSPNKFIFWLSIKLRLCKARHVVR